MEAMDARLQCKVYSVQCKGFSRQEYWSRLPFPSPENLPDPGIELQSPTLQADALTSEPPGKLQCKVDVAKSGGD